MHRRHLVDRAAEALEHGGQIRGTRVYWAHLEHLPLGVARARAAAELECRKVFFVRVQQRSGKFGRLAEKQHEQAARERVERSGVARLPGLQQALRLLQGAVGADAERLVEEQRAVDHSLGLTESMRRESRSPRSTETSY